MKINIGRLPGMIRFSSISCVVLSLVLGACVEEPASSSSTVRTTATPAVAPQQQRQGRPADAGKSGPATPAERLVAAAIDRTNYQVRYDPAYVVLDYPNGDVPAETGVCTDEVIRSYRKLGIDLQREVHEDMKRNFHLYPRKWGLSKPDSNIDHRRVPNLMRFFERKGETLPLSDKAEDYVPGDIVAWDLGDDLTHIGIVVNVAAEQDRYMIVHNIGAGPKMEDVLFSWKIIGHYRYPGQGDRPRSP